MVSLHALVLQFRTRQVINRQELRSLRAQVDVLLAAARSQATGGLVRVSIEELQLTLQVIASLNLEGPPLQHAMFQLEELDRELAHNLAGIGSGTAISAPRSGTVVTASSSEGVTAASIEIQIYVDNTAAGPLIEDDLRNVLSEIGVAGLYAADPVIGSWYRRLFGSLRGASRTQTAQELRRAAEIQLIDRFQAGIDGATAGAVSGLIASLATTRGAVIQAGSVLLVKVEEVIVVRQLTPAQLSHWNENPGLFRDPTAALNELQRAVEPSPADYDRAPIQPSLPRSEHEAQIPWHRFETVVG
jgi:hypothetical protein